MGSYSHLPLTYSLTTLCKDNIFLLKRRCWRAAWSYRFPVNGQIVACATTTVKAASSICQWDEAIQLYPICLTAKLHQKFLQVWCHTKCLAAWPHPWDQQLSWALTITPCQKEVRCPPPHANRCFWKLVSLPSQANTCQNYRWHFELKKDLIWGYLWHH